MRETTENERRATERLESLAVAGIYNVSKIGARLQAGQETCQGTLLDLSAGGLAMLTPSVLAVNQEVEAELLMGERRLRAQGLVKNRNRVGEQYRLGVQFTQLAPEEEGLLQLLYGPGGDIEEIDGLAEE